jgi:multidrug efflux pump subunit AcrB
VYFEEPINLDLLIRKYVKRAKRYLKDGNILDYNYIVENVDSLVEEIDFVTSIYEDESDEKIQYTLIVKASYNSNKVNRPKLGNLIFNDQIQKKKSAQIILKDSSGIANYKQITLTVAKLAGTNAVFVTDDVKSLLEKYKDRLNKQGISYIVTRDYGVRANEAVNELVHHLVITIAIIAVMLVFFLGWKESIIVTFTVPAILAVTLFVAYMTDQTINRITLFAFLLSLGLLVDAAIIVIENIHRHFHSHESEHIPKDELLVKATDEIGAPTNIATLAIILTMVPMAFVGGMMGEFMKPIPYNVPVALIASLFIAYIFTPYLSNKLLKRSTDGAHHHKIEEEEE